MNDDWKGEDLIKIGNTVEKGYREGAEKWCSVKGCDKQLSPANTSGFCRTHFRTRERQAGRAK